MLTRSTSRVSAAVSQITAKASSSEQASCQTRRASDTSAWLWRRAQAPRSRTLACTSGDIGLPLAPAGTGPAPVGVCCIPLTGSAANLGPGMPLLQLRLSIRTGGDPRAACQASFHDQHRRTLVPRLGPYRTDPGCDRPRLYPRPQVHPHPGADLPVGRAGAGAAATDAAAA